MIRIDLENIKKVIKQKPYVVIGLAAILIIILVFVPGEDNQPEETDLPSYNKTTQQQNILEDGIKIDESNVKILGTTPNNGEKKVAEDSKIAVTFDKGINQGDKEKFRIDVYPQTQGTQAWVRNIQLIFTPEGPLSTDTEYSVNVVYDTKTLYTFTFKTMPFTQEELEEQALEQIRLDIEYSQNMQDYVQKRPWHLRMPVDTDEYVIVYDYEKESFRIRIKTSMYAPANERDDILEKALDQLQSIGVNVEDYGYYVLYLDS